MIKKILPVTILLLLCASVVFAADFPDMQGDHWAYSAVSTLVNDGTIGGYEDGTFKPGNTVTRAEFVKMIGKSDLRSESGYIDVTENHWAYDYVMYSGLDGITDTEFRPDIPITRYDVAKLIWKRNGSKTGLKAPEIVTKQGKDKDVIAWVYSYGIMIGDDGINLRLNDSLSRAEAAVLIIRAREINDNSPKIDFINTVKGDVLEAAFNSSNLFDSTYNAEASITNGELALAAIRYALGERDPSYRGYSTEIPFEHKYAKALYVFGQNCIGKDKITAEFADKNATVKDAVTAMTFGAARKTNTPLKIGAKNDYYKEIASVDTDSVNINLTFAYNKGVTLYADSVINADKAVTHKELAAILLQMDGIVGVHSSITVAPGLNRIEDESMNTGLANYPSNSGLFQTVISSVPAEVYQAPLTYAHGNSTPKDSFNFTSAYGTIYTNALKAVSGGYAAKGTGVEITYYPSMVYDNGNGYTMRLKYTVKAAPQNSTIGSLFGVSGAYADTQVSEGLVFYAEVSTGQRINNIVIEDASKIKIDKILYVVK